MSVDAAALEGSPVQFSIRERLGDVARNIKGKFVKEKTPAQKAAIAEFKRIDGILSAAVKKARAAYHRAPLQNEGGKFAAFANHADSDVSVTEYRDAVSQYRNFLFDSLGEQRAELFLYDEADRAAGKYVSLLASKILGAAAGVGFVAVGGGTNAVASIVPGFLMSKALSHKKAIGTVSPRVAADIAAKEVEAKAAGQTHEQFTRANASLLKERRLSKFWRFSARWGTGIATSVGTYGLLHHSLGQLSSGLSDHLLHDQLANAFGDRVAHDIANGTGDYWRFLAWSRATTSELSTKAIHGLHDGLQNAFQAVVGGPASAEPLTSQIAPLAERSELPAGGAGSQLAETSGAGVTPEKPVLVDKLGGAPWNIDRTVALDDAHLEKAADLAIKGGMRPEFRDEFIAALKEQRMKGVGEREIVQIQNKLLDWMLTRKGVLGIGDRDVELRLSKPTSAEHLVLKGLLGSDGKTHDLELFIPEVCDNISGIDHVVGETPKVLLIPTVPNGSVPPPAPEVCRVPGDTQWVAQEVLANKTHMITGGSSLERSPGGYTLTTEHVGPPDDTLKKAIAEDLRRAFADAKADGLFDNGRDFILIRIRVYDPETCTYQEVIRCMYKDGHLDTPFVTKPGSSRQINLTPSNFDTFIAQTREHPMYDGSTLPTDYVPVKSAPSATQPQTSAPEAPKPQPPVVRTPTPRVPNPSSVGRPATTGTRLPG